MRMLVTGASGFVGGVLSEMLVHGGHEVVPLVRRRGSEPAGTIARVGDLRDGPGVHEALMSERPDCVVHLAAEIASQRNARKLRAANVTGMRLLLDACLAMA